MERVEELCCYYISFLRAIGLLHQNNHWLSKGKNFYGQHLLFERIYKSAQEDVDLAAEKFVGLFNEECLDLNAQSKLIQKTLEKFSGDNLIQLSLSAEKEFLEFSQKIYDTLKENDELSLGMDDMLMSVASRREEAVYLLKQSLDEKEIINTVEARINFLKRFQKTSSKK